MSFRSAPQINHLKDLEPFIKIIAFEKIPYTSIEGKNFKQLPDNTYQEILRWKNENGFSNGAGYFQELSALLNTIGITKTEPLNDDDLEGNFSTTNIVMKEITNGRKNSVLTLTEIGFKKSGIFDATPIALINLHIFNKGIPEQGTDVIVNIGNKSTSIVLPQEEEVTGNIPMNRKKKLITEFINIRYHKIQIKQYISYCLYYLISFTMFKK